MLFMPARVPGTTAIKIVSVPKGGSDGLPGTTLVLDEVSGKVRAVINARRLTAVRNAAGE
jgi:ornithine cyclodeaminase